MNIEIKSDSILLDGIEYVRKEKTLQGEPKFEVFNTPCWVIVDSAVCPCPIYVTEQNGNELRVSSDTFVEAHNARLCTPAEIEAHLRKICDEKYVGKKVKCLQYDDTDTIGVIEKEGMVRYYDSDEFWMEDTNEYMICVYMKGRFAEILPNKKPLPKTKYEYRDFLHQYKEANTITLGDTGEFLDQYDFNE